MLDSLRRRSSSPTNLLDIIGEVRTRWRTKLALRGALAVAGIGFGLFLLAAYGMEWARFSGASIIAARVAMLVVIAASAYWFLWIPLRRRVTDEQVAMYLEENEPSLQATLLSAVETSQNGHIPESAALVRRVIEQAIDACVRMDASRRVEQQPLRRYAAALGGVALVALLALVLGPAFLRNAMSAMFLLSSDVEAASPYRIEVKPGNITVPKGADQTVSAKLLGFDSEDVTLRVQRTPGGPFESLPLVRNENGTFDGMIFDVNALATYQVIGDRVQSPLYKLTVVDVPYVQRLELEYHFPAYTGLEPEKIEDGGDIAVLRGTEVRLKIFPTMKSKGGRIALNEKESVNLTPQADGTFTASFVANQDGFYKVEFDAPNGERVVASPQYTIDVLADQPPTVSFNRPGRDTSVSPI